MPYTQHDGVCSTTPGTHIPWAWVISRLDNEGHPTNFQPLTEAAAASIRILIFHPDNHGEMRRLPNGGWYINDISGVWKLIPYA